MPSQVLLSTILTLILEYRKARERQKLLNPQTGIPDDPNTPEREDFLEDSELISLFASENKDLGEHAAALLKKYST